MSENQATIKPGSTNWLWREVSEEIAETLTPTQKEAIEAAISRSTADSQPADLRFTIGGYFIRIMAGKERRSRDRVKKEQQENPVFQKRVSRHERLQHIND